jgi:type II secretory pathway pseudopilin PulG
MADGQSPRRLASTRGVSLLETVVALGLFAIAAATSGNFLVGQIRFASSNYLYTQAYSLAEQQLESMRAQRYDAMAPSSKTVAVGGANYTVQTQLVTDSPTTGMKKITVNVGWTDQTGTKNVSVYTVYTEVQRN